MTLGHTFSNRFEQLLKDNNLTLICVDRPGYGRSDPPRDWRSGLEEWIDLYPELARALEVDEGPVVTQTGGVMLATAAAAHHPQLITGICAFAGGVPIIDRTKLSYYPQQVRLISMAARMSPSILRFLIMNATNYFKTPEGRDRMKAMPFAELLAIQLIEADPSKIVASIIVRPDLCTTGQSIHGGALMAFADSIAATGAFLTLPEGALGTTTIESKTNFLGAASVGTELIGTATPIKIGSRVSVWQTSIRKQDGKQVALTTQTQLVLK